MLDCLLSVRGKSVPGEDVVGDGGNVVLVPEVEAKLEHQCSLSRANRSNITHQLNPGYKTLRSIPSNAHCKRALTEVSPLDNRQFSRKIRARAVQDFMQVAMLLSIERPSSEGVVVGRVKVDAIMGVSDRSTVVMGSVIVDAVVSVRHYEDSVLAWEV